MEDPPHASPTESRFDDESCSYLPRLPRSERNRTRPSSRLNTNDRASPASQDLGLYVERSECFRVRPKEGLGERPPPWLPLRGREPVRTDRDRPTVVRSAI